jgi:hypothetical protein
MDVAKEVFAAVDPEVIFTPLKKDGDDVKKGEKVLELEGRTLSILKAERTALNFMQRLSGIASALARVRGRRQKIRRDDCGHAQNPARSAPAGQIRRAHRRSPQPPHQPGRQRDD